MSAEELRGAIWDALSRVNDPEIHRPITDLGMVAGIEVDEAGHVGVDILLTIAGCPLTQTIRTDVSRAVMEVPGVTGVQVNLGVMTDEQRAEMRRNLRGGQPEREIVFNRPDSLTRVYLVASGKGGVGKSSVTVNLAMALAQRGRSVGLLDADIYGHSVPQMLGLMDARPTTFDDMILPVPSMGLKVISVGMLKPSRDQVVALRGPILHKMLQQLLSDVFWGDLDFLLLDLPPGTGDVAMSLGSMLPGAEVIVVTTPQQAAAEVAERAGTMASMLDQRVLGVVENMAYLDTVCPHCGQTHRVDVFGSGGGDAVAAGLTGRLGYEVPLLAQIPLDPAVRVSGDEGLPIVATDPDSPAAKALEGLADRLAKRSLGLSGKRLGVTPVSS